MEDGRSQRYIVSHSTVQRILQHFGDTGRNTRRPGSDRKRANTSMKINLLFCFFIISKFYFNTDKKIDFGKFVVQINMWTIR